MGLNKWWKKNNGTTEIMSHTTTVQTESTNEVSQQYATTKKQTEAGGGKKHRKRTNPTIRKKRRISESDYDTMKMLRANGISFTKIAEIIQISEAHCRTVLSYKTWDDYCKFKQELLISRQMERAKKKEQVLKDENKVQDKELEQWQFIVGWQTDDQRIKANAVRDLAKSLGLKVIE